MNPQDYIKIKNEVIESSTSANGPWLGLAELLVSLLIVVKQYFSREGDQYCRDFCMESLPLGLYSQIQLNLC